jgi:hypothetical protein
MNPAALENDPITRTPRRPGSVPESRSGSLLPSAEGGSFDPSQPLRVLAHELPEDVSRTESHAISPETNVSRPATWMDHARLSTPAVRHRRGKRSSDGPRHSRRRSEAERLAASACRPTACPTFRFSGTIWEVVRRASAWQTSSQRPRPPRNAYVRLVTFRSSKARPVHKLGS